MTFYFGCVPSRSLATPILLIVAAKYTTSPYALLWRASQVSLNDVAVLMSQASGPADVSHTQLACVEGRHALQSCHYSMHPADRESGASA